MKANFSKKKIALAVSLGLVGAGFSNPALSAWNAGTMHNTPISAHILKISINENALDGAEKFVDAIADQGIGFLSDSNLSDQKRKSEFQKLLKNNFDMNTIARFALGRYWKTASQAQRDEYMKLFETMILNVYSSRFSEYKGEKLSVEGSRPEGKNDILVNSTVAPENGQQIKVDWRVRLKNGQYKIVDVIVEGVSMSLTQRSDFSSVIQRGGGDINVLLDHLRQQ